MSAIGVLNLIYSADTNALVRGTAKTRAEVKSVGEVVESTKSHIGGLLAGVGAALGINSLKEWVLGSMEAINATRVLGERLGTSTEALSRLQYAAKISDVDNETLAGSLMKMERNLAEVASTGSGKAADALQRLGLSAGELASEDPVDAFHALVGAIGGISNPAERMKSAVDIFGKSAQGILNMAVQGSDGLQAMEEDADKLGITFNDLDAAKVDEAYDAMTAIWETVAGVGRSLAVELAPWITKVATGFTDWLKDGVDTGDLISKAMGWITTAVGRVADAVQALSAVWQGFKSVALEAVSKTLQGLGKLTEGMQAFLLPEYANGQEIRPEFAEAQRKAEAMRKTLQSAAADLQEWSKASENAAVTAYEKGEKIWSQPWAHEAIGQNIDAIMDAANGRAAEAVEKAKKFRGGRGDEIEAEGKTATAAKAMELGSAEAANTILRTRFGGGGKDMAAVANHTKRTADGIDKMVAKMAAFTGQTELEVMEEFSR